MLSDRTKELIKERMGEYPDKRSAIMAALHLAQHDYGWLPDEAIQELADLFELTTTEVGAVASFYAMFAREKVGKHTIMFCNDLPCALVGGDEMLEHLEHKLGCKAGQTTPNGQITLREAECLGGCNHGPVMLIDGQEQLQDLTNEKIDEIIDRLMKE